eukprot:7378267-Prymnesium_polylepis.3
MPGLRRRLKQPARHRSGSCDKRLSPKALWSGEAVSAVATASVACINAADAAALRRVPVALGGVARTIGEAPAQRVSRAATLTSRAHANRAPGACAAARWSIRKASYQ